MDERYFRRGFNLKAEIQGILDDTYHSDLVEEVAANGYALTVGETTICLPREFGFCYGVDRAVKYAYETRRQFPQRRIFITGEIIHNPLVNRQLQEMGIRFLDRAGDSESLQQEDVVIIPAFGVPTSEFERFRSINCILVDTTCGSVLNVWKNVEQYAGKGYTAVIHGKYDHEETRATASRSLSKGGMFLIVRDMDETQHVCEYIRNKRDRRSFMDTFDHAVSPGFDPDRHLERIGLANQTTMLMSESLAIAEALAEAMVDRYGKRALPDHLMSFDTICSATQERQDALIQLLEGGTLDLMVIVGGYNSSNTNNLANIASRYIPAYHIDGADCLLGRDTIRHKPVNECEPLQSNDWLPDGPATIGVTAGASTPNSTIGQTIERIFEIRDEHPC